MAHTISGSAKARGLGSYSKVRTAGPATVAPSETIIASSHAAPVERPSAVAIRYTPQMPSARVTTCWMASTPWKSKGVTACSASAASS